ncbi:MAG: PQQ-binding-like beta-propeller repeat protein [Caldisericia bacterium]|nr:PQQ-binding-like beta-propeller repeat protein [Caldisericia bacterium]
MLGPFGKDWNAKLGGIGFSAFAVADVPDIPLRNDKLVMRLAFVSTKDGVLYALDWQTGEIIWHQKLSGQAGDPLFAKGRVYVSCADGSWNCYSAWDGTPVWSSRFYSATTVLDPIWKDRAENAAPVADEERLYAVHSTKNVMAFDLVEGREQWHYQLGDAAMSSPVLVDDKLIVVDYSMKVTALNTKTGSRVWVTDIQEKVNSSLLCDGTKVYVVGSFGKVFALSIQDGSISWTLDSGGLIEFSSCFVGKFLAIPNCTKKSIDLVSLDTGVVKESFVLNNIEIGSALVASDNYVCFGTKDGNVCYVDLEKKTAAIGFSFESSKMTGTMRVYGYPAILHGRLLITDGMSEVVLLAPKELAQENENQPIENPTETRKLKDKDE